MGGWAAQTRWQKAGGHGFPVNKPLTPEAILSKWDVITNFGRLGESTSTAAGADYSGLDDGRATYPTSTQDAFEQVRSPSSADLNGID